MIKVSGVHKKFKSKQVLRGVDLEIRDAETLTIIGGSGCGKSVLLKNIIGLLKPEEGEIFVDGKETTRLDESDLLEVQKKFGYLFQGAALFDSLTVGENVAFGLNNMKTIPPNEIGKRVLECLAMVGLKGVENLKPAELSGGMKKRVGLARAIAHKPEYIMYDEPTTGLDPIMADVINDLIIHLQKQLGVTSIVVTHDMKSAYKVSNRIAMLYEGKIIGAGSPDEIKNSKDAVVHQFVEGLSQGPITLNLDKNF
ncbi:MAG TPA: ABC transporter ATP-binding protein [Elusimicrobia bacterium]|nr:MAG: ABC transporter ATP-binding protein [Elusimicrobia bacterium RIFOXYA12_FULL_49_49]OGS09719.1 MAG: ABC transporter ATP-binding protein [Elusimicrobia bacterium RIFOXYB1_FULL_48_9]OGS10272.1 MAG: ABC transporter ATP-binding protein [Elusimicrobia bacterium RIFOXYA1_FULL_47_7]OGS16609.1 MAG: ABC transporter ATP-binding protein [Elusimicrobia bacterium RIFOXYA2_FULL_47_53]OGS25818.1 MAG: ABC transporter ATP-binding protein [Elusimicrobia bacterium RIFOXYB12_FULL_50_12]OGS31587.1 MAG: ABC t